MQVQTFREPDSTSPRYPRKPKSTKFCDILAKKSVWQLQNSLFSIKSSSGVDSPEDTRRRSISVALPNSSPVKRYDQKAVPIHHTSNDENKRHYCGALLNFANVDLKTMPRIWTACTDTNGEPAFLLPNFRQVIAASFFFFFGSWYWSNISGKKKRKKAGRLSICRLVHNQHRVKIHIQIRDIERNIPNQPLWQHLGAPLVQPDCLVDWAVWLYLPSGIVQPKPDPSKCQVRANRLKKVPQKNNQNGRRMWR